MKEVNISASHQGNKFDKTIEMPESLSEAVGMFGDETIYKGWYRSKIIDLQSSLRRPATSGGSVAKKTIYDKLVAKGMSSDEAAEVSGYAVSA